MKYLILGSSGIIGLALTKYLIKKGHKVYGMDIEQAPNEDLRLPRNRLLIDRVNKCDFIFFLAYDIGGATCVKDYQNSFRYIHNNISIMKETFEILKEYKNPFIFSSSEMANMSYSAYGCLKAIGEYYSKSLNQPIVKLWNIYGIEHDRKKFHVVADFIRMALEDQQIRMITTGEEERQMLFIDDACECLEILSKKFNDIPSNQEIHIAGFKWYTIRDVAEEISLNFHVPVVPGKQQDLTHKGQKFEPNKFILKYWKPKTSLKKGINIGIIIITILRAGKPTDEAASAEHL